MPRKKIRPCCIKILTILILCFLVVSPVRAQVFCDDLYESFREAKRGTCGQREEAVRLGKSLIQKYGKDKESEIALEIIKKQMTVIEESDNKCRSVASLEDIYAIFRTEMKQTCGNRDEAISLGKFMLDKFREDLKDELNVEVLEFIKKRTEAIEKEDGLCRRVSSYCNPKLPKTVKNRRDFFNSAKEIINTEGDTPAVLDIMLDLVSVGYDLAIVDKDDTFNQETLDYAKTAIQRIEAGQTSSTKKWGVFVPFSTKENALSWMNYVIGWTLFNKQNQQREALGYFFKAIQTGEKKKDIGIYTTLGKYYFDEAVQLDAKYREKRIATGNEENEETKVLLALARGAADRALDAFGRAYLQAIQTDSNKQLKNTIYKTLTDLYKFRFNEATDEGMRNFWEQFIEYLRRNPMPDPSKPFEPVLRETTNEKLKRLRDY
jgi:tetratricopeptide (TPR) repeat protein